MPTSKSQLFSATLLFSSVLTYPVPVAAYPIDCAIFLCLAGGFPPNPHCNAAKAEFIRRVTPNPHVEPPLQLWRCPMSVAYHEGDSRSPMERLYDVVFDGGARPALYDIDFTDTPEGLQPPLTRVTSSPLALPALRQAVEWVHPQWPCLHLAQDTSNGSADIDLSGSEFDFVRSIKVWHIWHYIHITVGDDPRCMEHYFIQKGTYGPQGGFAWARVEPYDVPSWTGLNTACDGRSQTYRAVGVEWQDYQGTRDTHLVEY